MSIESWLPPQTPVTDEQIVESMRAFLAEASEKAPQASALERFGYAVDGTIIYLNLRLNDN